MGTRQFGGKLALPSNPGITRGKLRRQAGISRALSARARHAFQDASMPPLSADKISLTNAASENHRKPTVQQGIRSGVSARLLMTAGF
jgi:hypothetical protein